MIWAATLRHWLPWEGGVAGVLLGLDSLFATGGGDVGSLIGISIFEKGQPNDERKGNRHARKNQRFEAQIRIDSKADQQQSDDKGDDETNDDAQHPCGKIRAYHIHCW